MKKELKITLDETDILAMICEKYGIREDSARIKIHTERCEYNQGSYIYAVVEGEPEKKS